jgi:uncharacterized membrane protein
MQTVRNLDPTRLAGKASAAAGLLRALANEKRLMILCRLIEGERSVGELVADKMPWIPNRISIPGLIARILMGKLTGACLAAAGGEPIWLGAVCGAVGGILGAFGGYYARTRSVKALGKPDFYVALAEDLICVVGCLWIVSRFQ